MDFFPDSKFRWHSKAQLIHDSWYAILKSNICSYSVRLATACTIWLFNIAMDNCPFIDDFPIETSVYRGFSMAMLNNQRVLLSSETLTVTCHSAGLQRLCPTAMSIQHTRWKSNMVIETPSVYGYRWMDARMHG